MKRRGLQPMHDQHINVTPLVDVVMCLIVFFLICGELVALDSPTTVNIPVARNGQDIPELRGRVVISVLPSETPAAPPAIQVLGKTIPFPYAELADGLRNAASENREVKVILRADQSVPYQFIAPILRICSEEKANSVHFATQDEGGGQTP